MVVLPKLLVCDKHKHFLNVNCVCVFRLNSSDAEGEPIYIQMVSALVLQLIQCVVHLPSEKDSEDDHKKVLVTHPTLLELVSFRFTGYINNTIYTVFQIDDDVFITNSYETARRTAQNFLSVFLKKSEHPSYFPVFSL